MTAKSLKHKFSCGVADGSDSTLIRPSNWNDDHDLWLGYRAVGVTTDTIAQTDHLSIVAYNNAAAIATSLPAPSGGNFALGWKTLLKNNGLGAVTVTPASTINGSSSAVTINQGEALELFGTGTADFVGIAIRTPATIPPVIRYDIQQSLS